MSHPKMHGEVAGKDGKGGKAMGARLLVVGGVAGGATAAARARRLDEKVEIILFERGEYVSFANCGLPYYVGEVIKKREDLLVTTASDLKKRYNIDVRIFTEVTSIDPGEKKVLAKNLRTGETYSETYDKLILAPGAEPVRPPLDGIHLDTVFNVRNIPDCDSIKALVDQEKPHRAVVVGGGYIGLEMVDNLVQRGVQTTVVEMLDQVLPPLDYEMASMVHEHLRKQGVELELDNSVTSFSKRDNRTVVSTRKGNEIECDMVILSVGVRPESKLAGDARLELGPTGGIKVDATMKTSDPDIYAVGDAVEVRDFVTGRSTLMALAGPANKQGRIAADNALGRKSLFRGTLGTAIVKIFDMTVAATGAAEKTLKKFDIPYLVSHTHSGSHASYYPGATMMAVKLLFSPHNGRILGAQIVGMDGVDKRIDVLATAIRGNMTVHDLEELELAYAPPYSSAKDPVNMAGFVAANILKGDMAGIDCNELDEVDRNQNILLDLRTGKELQALGSIEGAIHIPVDDLRNRLSGLELEKNYILFCAVGLRSYIGHRILTQNGFESKNLKGGYRTYLSAKKRRDRTT